MSLRAVKEIVQSPGDHLATAVTQKRDLPTNIAAALSTSIKHSKISSCSGEVLRLF